MIEVTISVKRDNGETKAYTLTELGESKKGTYKTFGVPGENADLPDFSKVYIKAVRDKEPAPKKTAKS